MSTRMGEQTPWISSTFFGDFVFRPEGAEADQEDEQAGEGEEEETEAPTLTGVYRANGTNPSGSKYTGIVALKEDGDDFKADLVDRQGRVQRQRPLRRQDAGDQLGRQELR